MYVLVVLALSPFGGSFVSLIPLYKTGTGKALLGILVNQSLKSWCASPSLFYSYILSNSTIQLTAKWQFYKQTQLPFLDPVLIASFAISPYPYPSDNIFNLSSKSFSLAKFSKYDMGSAPGDKMKIIGVAEVESEKAPFKSNYGDSINFYPKFFLT